MKKVILLLILLFVSIQFHAQDFNKILNTDLVKLEDYKKAEPDVLKCADFLFKTPFKPKSDHKIIAMAHVIKWMSGTDAYTFNIGDDAMKVTKGSDGLFAMYMVALTKVVLENPSQKFSDLELHNKSVKLLAEYSSKKENKLRPSKALKKIIKKMKKD